MQDYKYINFITKEMVKNKLPKREKDFHKGNFGKLLTLCGSRCMPGAANFVLRSALSCGVGSIKVCAVSSLYAKISDCEPTFCILDEDEQGYAKYSSINEILKNLDISTACVMGSGLGLTHDTKNIIYDVIRNSNIPLIIDADGINAVSENIDILKESKCKILLTPHAKEMSRLIGIDPGTINKDKAKFASEFAKKYNVCVVLKGPETVVCDENENIFVNTSGNVGMAKGGSGDVLAGMISSFAAQKIPLVDAAICGVFIHGFAGDISKKRFSTVSMTPTEIINTLPEIFLGFGM